MGLKSVESSTGADELNNHSEFSFTVSGSVATDNGLTFSASQTQLTSNNGSIANDGTTVSVSGAFGKISFGSVAEADEIAALGDLGFDGIGMDDAAEAYTGDSLNGHGHDVAWSYTVGNLALQVSGLLGEDDGTAAQQNESYAFGVKYTMNGLYAGLGYNDTDAVEGATTATDGVTTTIYLGGTVGALSIASMFTTMDSELSTQADRDSKGVNVAYDAGNGLTLRAAYADNDTNASDSTGVGFSYAMGGGVTLAGGIGSENDLNQADLGFTFSF